MLVLSRKAGEQVQCTSPGQSRMITIGALSEKQVQIHISGSRRPTPGNSSKTLLTGDRVPAPQTRDQATSPEFVTSKQVGGKVSFLLEGDRVTLTVLALDSFVVKIGVNAPPQVSIFRTEVLSDGAPDEREPRRKNQR